MNERILRLLNHKNALHKKNGQIIDMMNDHILSVSDAKEMLKINAEEIERLSDMIILELQSTFTHSHDTAE